MSSSVAGCGPTKHADFEKRLDSIDKLLAHADQDLALDPDLIQKRVDTMIAQLLVIDSVFPQLSGRGDEVAVAYNVYRSALLVFQDYVDKFDGYLFENQSLRKEMDDLAQELGQTRRPGEELNKRIRDLKARTLRHCGATKALIRSYLDIIRPFLRKRKVIDHMFHKMVESDMIGHPEPQD
ncbi:MAG: hypothetical protein HYZ16_03460 [Bacteroidetes bacterium]|nr:hypothetical protein [Bacteroidota bacterium]